MDGRRVDLHAHEDVVFECGPAMLTNQRILANWKDGGAGGPSNEALLKDVASVRQFTGGHDSRIKPGLNAVALGALLVLIEFRLPDIPSLLAMLLFLGGAICVVVGLYLIQGSLLRPRPRTTVMFTVIGAPDVAVNFPGHDNPEAEQLARRFARLKRGI